MDDDLKMDQYYGEESEIFYEPTREERKKLSNMFIKLAHEVRPQHKIEKSAGTRTLKQREKEEFEKYVTLKLGTFDESEDDRLKKNWRKFCKQHDWDPENPKPFLYMKHKSKEFYLSLRNRLAFVQYLAHKLWNRCLYSIYQRFKILFTPHKTCRYDQLEDEKILRYVQNYSTVTIDRKFADLALILNRTRASVWRRYRILKKRELGVKTPKRGIHRRIVEL